MIDFTFSEEQDLFRKAAKEFAETKNRTACANDGTDKPGLG